MGIKITNRERELLLLIREGLPNREIAERLGVGEQTVKNALAVLYQKFHVRNRTQLALIAVALSARSNHVE